MVAKTLKLSYTYTVGAFRDHALDKLRWAMHEIYATAASVIQRQWLEYVRRVRNARKAAAATEIQVRIEETYPGSTALKLPFLSCWGV